MDTQTAETTSTPKPYPVSVLIPHQERYSRWLALATILLAVPKLIILIPHIILLYVLRVAMFIVGIIAQFVVLFTGKYPKVLNDLVAGSIRWHARVAAYLFGLTDKYPPFRLEE